MGYLYTCPYCRKHVPLDDGMIGRQTACLLCHNPSYLTIGIHLEYLRKTIEESFSGAPMMVSPEFREEMSASDLAKAAAESQYKGQQENVLAVFTRKRLFGAVKEFMVFDHEGLWHSSNTLLGKTTGHVHKWTGEWSVIIKGVFSTDVLFVNGVETVFEDDDANPGLAFFRKLTASLDSNYCLWAAQLNGTAIAATGPITIQNNLVLNVSPL